MCVAMTVAIAIAIAIAITTEVRYSVICALHISHFPHYFCVLVFFLRERRNRFTFHIQMQCATVSFCFYFSFVRLKWPWTWIVNEQNKQQQPLQLNRYEFIVHLSETIREAIKTYTGADIGLCNVPYNLRLLSIWLPKRILDFSILRKMVQKWLQKCVIIIAQYVTLFWSSSSS